MKLNSHEKALIIFLRENPDWTLGISSNKSTVTRRAEISKLRELGLTMVTISSLLGISERQCYRVMSSNN